MHLLVDDKYNHLFLGPLATNGKKTLLFYRACNTYNQNWEPDLILSVFSAYVRPRSNSCCSLVGQWPEVAVVSPSHSTKQINGKSVVTYTAVKPWEAEHMEMQHRLKYVTELNSDCLLGSDA